jgi:hypothetical protein
VEISSTPLINPFAFTRVAQTDKQSSDAPVEKSSESEDRKNQEDLKRSEKTDTKQADKKEEKQELTDKKIVDDLKKRDLEVKTHEAAHLAAAGQFAKGGAKYTYEQGPDGKRYAVGGEVSIDTSPIPGNPEASIRKAETIRRAALAPNEPSATDQSVAAQASQLANKARTEKKEEQSEELDKNPLLNSDKDEPTIVKSSESEQDKANSEPISAKNKEAVSLFEAVGASQSSHNHFHQVA